MRTPALAGMRIFFWRGEGGEVMFCNFTRPVPQKTAPCIDDLVQLWIKGVLFNYDHVSRSTGIKGTIRQEGIPLAFSSRKTLYISCTCTQTFLLRCGDELSQLMRPRKLIPSKTQKARLKKSSSRLGLELAI